MPIEKHPADKFREHWKQILVYPLSASFIAPILYLYNFGNSWDIEIAHHALAAGVMVIGYIADLHSTLKGIHQGKIIEINPFLPDKPTEKQLLEHAYSGGYILTVLAALFPYAGLPFGVMKILISLDNYKVLRKS